MQVRHYRQIHYRTQVIHARDHPHSPANFSTRLFCCPSRKHRPSYESIALTPRKYWSGGSGGPGWCGEAETNIPALLFPKHVLGLHASDDLAFHRDFEAVHSCSRRLTLNNAAPDILNSNRGTDFVNGQTPFFLDGWQSSGEYIGLTGESPFSLESTWKLIWDQKVSFIVTLLTSVAKVTLLEITQNVSFEFFNLGILSLL